ncbi:MAG: lysine--tRNA ligase [Alphaproteobacteria bacterium]
MTMNNPAWTARAWPFIEARRIMDRFGGQAGFSPPAKGHILLETGYGPSGLPHIGTFAEVLRTSMVRRALAELTDTPLRLISFSDDMDGMRRVPDNVPNAAMMAEHLGKPLSAVPDPFGTHESFAAHNNARLRGFLDSFGFAYEFVSASECYRAGRFDDALRGVLRHYDEVMAIMLPSLGAERQKTYSPFLPLSPATGRVLQVPIIERYPDRDTIVFEDETGQRVETPVTGGHCKLQWKVDWAMRWAALGVDYEMSGKDLIDSVRLSSRLCQVLGSPPPVTMIYELFLDEKGERISKSKGNGLAVEDWLRYAPEESLATFMFQKPATAKRLYFDGIPRAVDDYMAFRQRAAGEDAAALLENPAWHIHAGTIPQEPAGPGFGLLLNLASVCHSEDKAVLWGFINRHAPDLSATTSPFLDRLVGHAIAYYRDFILPAKHYATPDPMQRAALEELAHALDTLPADADAEAIQTEVYEIGKRHPFASLRDWFRTLYTVLLGQEQGPRFGSFVALYGRDETRQLIAEALARAPETSAGPAGPAGPAGRDAPVTASRTTGC